MRNYICCNCITQQKKDINRSLEILLFLLTLTEYRWRGVTAFSRTFLPSEEMRVRMVNSNLSGG